MNTNTLRIGWIGCGLHANEMLLPQLTRYDVRIQSLCDTDQERLDRTAQRYGVAAANTTRDWKALLARTDIDAIGLAAGPHAHYEIGQAALAAGYPVFMEKPPAATAREADQLAQAARTVGKPVVLGFMKRYSTANRIGANVIHNPDFGQAASFLGQYMTAPTYFEKDPDYTGFFLHHCVHYLDLVPFLMGPIADLSVRSHILDPGKILLHVDFRFTSGGIGTLVVGTHQSRGTPMEWWQVMADHQRVEVRNVHEVRHFRSPAFKVSRPEATLLASEDTLVWEPNLTVAANEDHKGYHSLIGEFLALVRGQPEASNPHSRAPNAEDGARAMHWLEVMIKSAQV